MDLGSASGRFCSLECAHSYSSKFVDRTIKKKISCYKCGREIEVSVHTGKQLCDECRPKYSTSISDRRGNGPCLKCKTGWHKTWNGKDVYYRSSYELDYCNELDEHKIDYEMESQKIKYFDSVRNEWRVAVPDFELKDSHTLVEVKSSYTFDKQNMIDKFKQYLKDGWNVELIYEHEHYPGLQCETI